MEIQDPTIERLIELPEVAAGLGWSTDRLYRAVRAGEVPHLRTGRRIWFSPIALQRWQQGTK